MATLVLSAAGSLLGPFGGAVGAILGQAIDGRILRPKGRERPRLQDLRIQASSYGTPLPKLFGTIRVAGTVIWSTDLIETRNRSGGGKGRPSTTNYSYSASFAVALSARPIRSVGRIWADGNLLRGAAGDWKQETGFRLHLGDEDQPVDPLIASAEGSGGTPAYRGCAYAVFENMALEPYGNRIPSLTFEVEADAAPVAIGDMLESLSSGTILRGGGDELLGFAAEGDSLAALIEDLSTVFPIDLGDADGPLRLRSGDGPPVELAADEIAGGTRRELPAAADAPSALALSYYDPARDYQVSMQSAGAGYGRAVRRLELPAVLSASRADLIARAALDRSRRAQRRCTIWCGWHRLDLEQGALIRLGGDVRIWRVAERAAERTGVRLELRAAMTTGIVPIAVDPGRALPAPDWVHGPTRLALLDLPHLEGEPASTPRLLVAAWGEGSGWRRAKLLISHDGGQSWEPVGISAQPAIAGTVDETLRPGATNIIDQVNDLVVELAHADMTLEDADDDGLLRGRNLALAGPELVQFGSALPLGGARWRLSRLLRGRRGTEWAVGAHSAGETFVLIETDALRAVQLSPEALHQPISVMASGIGDPTPVQEAVSFEGECVRPPAPKHLKVAPDPDGGFKISWIRRSRAGWVWGDVDAPLAEMAERYRWTIRRADGAQRVTEVEAPSYHYCASAVSSDLSAGTFVDISVVQIGTFAVSRPASVRVHIGES